MEKQQNRIHIVAVVGTTRPGNYTSKAVNIAVDELKQHPECSYDIIDPAQLNLSFPGGEESSDSKKIRDMVSQATGVILSTPEYHGSYSSVIKLVIENLGFPSVLSGKPIALLGVAAGAIGAIKSLESLRGVCSHVGAIVLPGPVSVAGVQKVFDQEGNCLDAGTEKKIRSVSTNLVHYIQNNICPRVALESMVRSEEAK